MARKNRPESVRRPRICRSSESVRQRWIAGTVREVAEEPRNQEQRERKTKKVRSTAEKGHGEKKSAGIGETDTDLQVQRVSEAEVDLQVRCEKETKKNTKATNRIPHAKGSKSQRNEPRSARASDPAGGRRCAGGSEVTCTKQ